MLSSSSLLVSIITATTTVLSAAHSLHTADNSKSVPPAQQLPMATEHQQDKAVATTASMIDARRQDAQRGMPACIAGMVAQQEQLRCNSGAKGFQIADVVDGGGFATLLKGQLLTASPPTSQIAAAKIAVDMSTDDEGKLTDHQRRSYQAGMRHEREIYERLSHGTNNGIPTVYFAGAIKKGGDSNHPSKLHFLSFMVMELLGPSVGQLSLELQTYKNNLRLLVNHGLGMLKVLRFMHKNNIIHRDIKPDNFCLPHGVSRSNPGPVDTVYIVDMGMAQQIHPQEFDWESKDCLYMGTVDYSSVRSLYGHHQCAWDDLEALAVTLLEMATGCVPFDLLHGDDLLTAERLQQMAAQKEQQWQKLLCNPQTPTFIKQFMRHLRSVPPKQHPTAADYTVLQDILKAALVPSTAAASSAWSSDVTVLQPQPAALAGGSSRKRPLAPAPSAASNMVSCMSEAATIIQPKRVKCLQQDEDDTTSMATGLLAFSQSLLCSQYEE